MNEDVLRQALNALDVAVAVVDPSGWAIAYENARFFQWFPPADTTDESLPARLSGFDVERAKARLAQQKPYTFEGEATVGARRVPFEAEARALPGGDAVVVECRNASKRKEAEYMLDSYSKMAERHARELQSEKDRAEKLLLNVMPRSIYQEMKDFGTTAPQRFDDASVLMLDFVGFTSMAVTRDPSSLIAELNDIFTAFDRIVELFGCERIKTIGDAYMAVSGLPEATPDHARNIARVALRMRRYLERRNVSHPEPWHCRIGINSGPVIGSIVGVQKYVYDIFGPGVNLAARMEATAEPMKIALGAEMASVLRDDFVISERGETEIKGFGPQRVFYLDAESERR